MISCLDCPETDWAKFYWTLRPNGQWQRTRRCRRCHSDYVTAHRTPEENIARVRRWQERASPEKLEAVRERQRRRYHGDPEYRARRLVQLRDHMRRRRAEQRAAAASASGTTGEGGSA